MTNRRQNRVRVATLASIVVISLLTSGSGLGAGRGEPSVEVLRSLVEQYAHAIEINNRELALWYVHPRSPFRSEIDDALRDQLSSFFERARILSLEQPSRSGETISVMINQETVRVFGLKFIHAKQRSIYRFREHDGSWWIWEIKE